MSWELYFNSLTLSAGVAVVATLAGGLCALAAPAIEWRWRRWLYAIAAACLVVPPFLAANCWMDLLGLAGRWRNWVPLNIFSWPGAALVLVLLYWPIAFFLLAAAWSGLDGALLEIEPAARGRWFVGRVLAPLGRKSMLVAAAVIGILALNNFSVPALLQVKAFPAELWVSFNTRFDHGEAWRLSAPMWIGALLLLGMLRWRGVRWPSLAGTAPPRAWRRQLGAAWLGAACVGFAALCGLSLGVPLAHVLAQERTWAELGSVLRTAASPALHTAGLAAVTATLVSASTLAGWRWRFGGLGWLPFLVPGVLFGVLLVWVFNRPGLEAVYPGLGLVAVAYAVRYGAPGWSLLADGIRSADRDLIDAARLAGVRGWRLWRHAIWPQIAARLGACWYLTYLLCLWDVETIVMIVPPGAETLALRVFNLLHYGHNSQVNALCVILLGLAAAPLALWPAGTRAFAVCQRQWTRVLRGAAKSARAGSVAAAAILGAAGLGGCARAPSADATLQSRLFAEVEMIGVRGTGLGQFHKPRSLALDDRGRLYVADITGRIQRFDPSGEFESFWRMPETDKGKPKGMARDALGRIIVIEPHYSRVNHFEADGKLAAQWGRHGTNVGDLAFPRSVAVDSRGRLYVSEYGLVERVQRFGPAPESSLSPVRVIGRGAGAGLGQFNRAEGLAVDRDDRLYVADSCNHRVQVFDAEGRCRLVFGRAGSGIGELSYPYDVAVDAEGWVYVCEFGNSRVQVFDREGVSVEMLGEPGSLPGQLSNPWSLALDGAGNLYVADSMNHRVQKWLRRRPLERHKRSLAAAAGGG